MKHKSIKTIICGTFALLAVGFCFHPSTVHADMGNYNFVSIDSGVVDSITVNGVTVEAMYRPYDSSVNTDTTYSCAAFVKRFYSQVYGRNVSGLLSTTSVPAIDSGSFSETNSPKVGDLIRDNQSVHWAIVKAVSGNTITIIQQNAWNGSYTQAWVGATIENGDSRYTFFTWDGNTASTTAAGNYTIHYQEPQIQETTAVVSAKVDNPNRVQVGQVGCYLWDANDTLIKKHTENCSRPESRFNMWYDIQGELGITLTPGTAYKYQFFIVQDGKEYPGSLQTFTTAGTAPAQTNTADNAPVSTEEMDAIVSTDDEVQRTIAKLRELHDWDKEELLLCMEPAFKTSEDGNTYYFPINTLMDRTATLIVTLTDDKVTRTEWRYNYSCDSDTAKQQSEDLYNQVVEVSDRLMDVERNSLCKDKNNMTSTYKNRMETVRDIEQGIPYVSITVTDDFSLIIY